MVDKGHIALDLDDVVIDFVSGLQLYLDTEYNYTLDEAEITAWRFHIDELDMGISEVVGEVLKNDRYLTACPEIAGSMDGIQWLYDRGYSLEFVTSRPNFTRQSTESWLSAHDLGHIPLQMGQDADKTKTDAVFLVDDRPKYVNGFCDSHEERHAALMRAGHNRQVWDGLQDDAGDARVYPVSGWFGIQNRVCLLENFNVLQPN